MNSVSMTTFPIDVTFCILNALPSLDVVKCQQVCQSWRELIDERAQLRERIGGAWVAHYLREEHCEPQSRINGFLKIVKLELTDEERRAFLEEAKTEAINTNKAWDFWLQDIAKVEAIFFPEMAKKTTQQIEDPLKQAEVYYEILAIEAKTDFEKAKKSAFSILHPRARAHALNFLVCHIEKNNKDEAQRLRLLWEKELAFCQSPIKPSKKIKILELAKSDLAGAKIAAQRLKDTVRDEVLEALVALEAITNVEEAEKTLSSIIDPLIKEKAYVSIVKEKCKTDLEGAKNIAHKMQTELKNEAFVAIIDVERSINIQAAKETAKEIPINARQRALVKIVQTEVTLDLEAAKTTAAQLTFPACLAEASIYIVCAERKSNFLAAKTRAFEIQDEYTQSMAKYRIVQQELTLNREEAIKTAFSIRDAYWRFKALIKIAKSPRPTLVKPAD